MKPGAQIGFAGTPAFAEAILAALLQTGYRPCVVYSQPDRPRGRGRKPYPSPVKALANSVGIEVLTPRSLRDEEQQQQLARYELDLLVVAAYGLILPPAILAAPRYGCLNVHASLLPRWRGAAPIERAIMAGDTETGVALMQMEAGLDTGPVHQCIRAPIDRQTTGGSLTTTLAECGSAALVELLPRIETNQPTPQGDDGVTYAHKLLAIDSLIDWRRSAVEIGQQVRALCERAPARSSQGKLQLRLLQATPDSAHDPANEAGQILRLDKRGLLIATGEGTLNATSVQLNRGKGQPLTAADLANGYADLLKPGTVLAAAPEA